MSKDYSYTELTQGLVQGKITNNTNSAHTCFPMSKLKIPGLKVVDPDDFLDEYPWRNWTGWSHAHITRKAKNLSLKKGCRKVSVSPRGGQYTQALMYSGKAEISRTLRRKV